MAFCILTTQAYDFGMYPPLRFNVVPQKGKGLGGKANPYPTGKTKGSLKCSNNYSNDFHYFTPLHINISNDQHKFLLVPKTT